MPKWGLFNGVFGTMIEIMYDKDKNSNHGDLLTCVIVDFTGYVGPVWDKNNPTARKKNAKVIHRPIPNQLTNIVPTACSHTKC